MAEMEYDSEDEILDKRSIATVSEDSEDEIHENQNVNDSATICMNWVDHDLDTIVAGKYSAEYDELASPELDAQKDGDTQILQDNSVVSGQGALTDHDVRPTESNVNEAYSVHETLTNPDRGIIAIGNGMPQNEVEELASLASSILNNENRTRHNGFPERSGPTPTPESMTAPTKRECSICSKKIANLPVHMKWCHAKLQQKITTKCPICSKELVNLPKHMNQCHGEAQERAPKTKCPICSQKFLYLASHMKMIHAETVKGTPKRQYLTSSKAKQCSICKKKIMDLPRHMKWCHERKPLQTSTSKCPICSKEVVKLPDHMKRSHREARQKVPKAQCPICLKQFMYLYWHIRSAHWLGTNKTTQNLPRNVRVPGVRTACPVCSIILTKKHLQRHLRNVHRSATIPTPIATKT